MKITFLKWGAVPLALLVSAAGASTVLAQDQPSSQSSPAATTPAQPSTAKKTTAAHYGNNKVGQRRENQQDRIAQGVKSGQLTPGETAKLEKQQQHINKQVAKDFVISSSGICAKCTCVVSTKLRRSASGNRTSVTPVSTECVRPESFVSICRASSLVRGLPNTWPSSTTSVSAAMMMAGPNARAATNSALASASRCTSSAGDSPAIGVSSTAEESTVKNSPASCRTSARRVEAEARINFMAQW